MLSFALPATKGGRTFEFFARIVLHNYPGRIEGRKALADDFADVIAFDTPGTGIPTCDVACGTQGENYIVLYRIDQGAMTLLHGYVGDGCIACRFPQSVCAGIRTKPRRSGLGRLGYTSWKLFSKYLPENMLLGDGNQKYRFGSTPARMDIVAAIAVDMRISAWRTSETTMLAVRG